jgi:hypothetical protein
MLTLVTPITLDCLLSWSNYLITTYTTFTFHDKWIMLSCQNRVLYITSTTLTIQASSRLKRSANHLWNNSDVCRKKFIQTNLCIHLCLLISGPPQVPLCAPTVTGPEVKTENRCRHLAAITGCVLVLYWMTRFCCAVFNLCNFVMHVGLKSSWELTLYCYKMYRR